MIKAYIVRIDEEEGSDIIVFAENPNKAKAIAVCHKSADGYLDYTELRPRRYPNADHFVYETPGIESLDFDNPEHARFVRNEGWHSCENGTCEECGLDEWNNIPESWLEDGVCEECRNSQPKEQP